MARYIDADNLINELSAACMPIYEKGITGILGDNSSIADIINEQPAADVQEVKRGYWQNKYRSGTTIKEGVVSSCCDMWNNRKSQFCPNCGARMDGDSSIADIINEQPAADVQEVKRGEWEFHKKTKLVPSNKVGIKEEYTNGHNCTIVDDKNVNQKIMIMMKRITLKIPVCSVCGWCGYDECDATPYCPNCGARMEEFEE